MLCDQPPYRQEPTDTLSECFGLLADMAPSLLAEDDPSRVFDAKVDRLARLIGLAGYAWYTVADDQHLSLTASGWAEASQTEAPTLSHEALAAGQGISQQVIRHRQPVLHRCLPHQSDESTVPLATLGITGYLCFPLLCREQLRGTLSFLTRDAQGWSSEAAALLQIVSHLWASTLEGAAGALAGQRRLERHRDTLQQSLDKLRSVAADHVVTEEQARRQMAHDLQDHLARPLSLGRMKLSHVIRQTTTASISALLHDIDQVMDQAVKFTDDFAKNLTPPVLHEQGFQPALQWLAAHLTHQGLIVTLRLPSPPPVLNSHEAIILFQAVRELLENVRRHAATERATLTVGYAPNGHLRMAVHDDGQGFTSHDGVHLHDPHERFGLFSVSEQMALLHGRMDIRSNPGQGTTVTLTVPCGSPPTSDRNESQSATTTQRLRVLLVDDHAMVRKGLRSILEGYHDLEVVGEAGDGLEAVKLARTRHPDVVVMDINMPRLDGIAATKQIKHDCPSTAVIAISVQDSAQVEQAMISAGAAAFLKKDCAASHLHDAIIRAR